MGAAPRELWLGHLTYAPLGIVSAIELAAREGFRGIGARLTAVIPGAHYDPLIEDAGLRRQTIGACRATGVRVSDVELVRLTPDFDARAIRPFLEVAAELGAGDVLAIAADDDLARLATSFAALAAEAARLGINADLEYLPWSPVADAMTALRVVETSGAANGRVLVDTLHTARSPTTRADLAALPRARLSYLQLCDAPAASPATIEGLLHAARVERLAPGEGALDLAGMIGALPAELAVSLEIPNHPEVAKIGVAAWVRRCAAATRSLLAARD